MFYDEIRPSKQLSPFIKCYWVLRQSPQETKGLPEAIMPDGCPELVFNLAAPFKRHRLEQTIIQPRSIVVGQIKQHVTVKPTGPVNLFGVRFTPSGIYPLIRHSVEELTDRIEKVDSVFGRLGTELESRINEAGTIEDRIDIFEQLTQSSFRSAEGETLSARALAIISASEGQIRVENVAKSLDTNWKTLQRHFSREVGVSPKFYSRITRLQKVLRQLNMEVSANWADIAYSNGYTDQSHFIRDFRSFTGVSPEAFVSRNNAISDSFVG